MGHWLGAPSLAATWLLAACAPAPITIELPPPGGGARVVVVAAPNARAASFFADARTVDATNATLPHMTVDGDVPVELVVLDYGSVGDALGVDGVVDERAPNDATVARRALEPWLRRRALRVDPMREAPPGPWTDTSTRGSAEQDLALRRSSPCAQHVPSRVVVSGDDRPLFVRTTTTTALLAFPSPSASTTWAAFRAEGARTELAPIDDPLGGRHVTALVSGPDGALFAGTQTTTTPKKNRLWRSEPGQSRFVPLADLDDGVEETIRWIAPVTGGVWVMSARGTLTRLERGRVAWRSPGRVAPNRDGALVAFGIERAVALLPFARGTRDARQILEVDADVVRTKTVDALEVASLLRLDRPEGPVVVAGNGRWGLAWLEGLTLNTLYLGEAFQFDATEVLALAHVVRDGRELVAYSGARGTLGTYALGFGPCPQMPIGGTVRSLTAFPGGILAAVNLNLGEVPNGGKGAAVWLERR